MNIKVDNPKECFTNRVEEYARYRPCYPQELVASLLDHCRVNPPTTTIADVGSGTGIFTQLLLERGCQVIGVEPNAAMRQQREKKEMSSCSLTILLIPFISSLYNCLTCCRWNL